MKAPRVQIVVKGKPTVIVSAKTAEKAAGESGRRLRAEFRKKGS